MKYEDPIIDYEKINRMYKEGFHGKARFAGPREEPDRRGFTPSSITYDEEKSLLQRVFQEKSESSAASSRDTYTGLPLGDIPLYLQTTLEDSDRIRDELPGHKVYRCANTDCRNELRGEKNVDYFRSYNAWYCQDCMQRLHVKRCAKEECSKELYGMKNVDYFKDHEGLLCKACYHAKYTEYCANPHCQAKLSAGRNKGWFWYNKQKFCPRCFNSKCT